MAQEKALPLEEQDGISVDSFPGTPLKILQDNKGFRFGTDAVLLAHFAKIPSSAKSVDLGTGTGIIPLLMSQKNSSATFEAIELQQHWAQMASRSVELNNLSERIRIIHGDVKQIKNLLPPNSFNAVTANPPYAKLTQGQQSPTEPKALARHETSATLQDFISAASYLLNSSGKFFMVHQTQRLPEILQALSAQHLEPKRLQFIQSTLHSAPNLFLVEAKKSASPSLLMEENIIIYNSDRTYTQQMQQIYSSFSATTEAPHID